MRTLLIYPLSQHPWTSQNDVKAVKEWDPWRSFKGATGDLENTILTHSNKHESFTRTLLIPLILYRFKGTTGTEV